MSDYLGLTGQYGVAHRGGALEHLENSPSAFQNAIELGYPVIETDVQATADGVLAVTHDADLVRTAGDRRRVARLTWQQLSTMRLLNGERPLRLEELLELSGGVRLNLDPKTNASLPPLIRLLKARPKLKSRVCIGSFDALRLHRFRSQLPGFATGLGFTEVRRLVLAAKTRTRFKFPDSVVAAQVPVKAFGVRIVTQGFVDFVKSHGRHVQVWTVDDEQEMRQLLNLGVNAVMTDRPTALKSVMEDLGNWQPAQ